MATRFAAVPAGVAMPPMSGPNAVAIINARPKLLRPGCSAASRSRPTPSGSSMAATAMSVIHHEMNAPTASTPRSTRSVRVPTRFKIWYTSRVPRPERVNAADNNSTPMKNTMIGSPNPARITARKSAMPNAGTSSTISSEVTANGSASDTQAVTAKAMMARQVLPAAVSATGPPAVCSGGGEGRKWMSSSSATAATSAVARLSFRGGDDAATAANCIIARLQAWGDDPVIAAALVLVTRVARLVEPGALAATSRGNRPSL